MFNCYGGTTEEYNIPPVTNQVVAATTRILVQEFSQEEIVAIFYNNDTGEGQTTCDLFVAIRTGKFSWRIDQFEKWFQESGGDDVEIYDDKGENDN